MSDQTSRLAIIIDSSGAQSNAESLTDALHGLTEWGQKAAASAGKVSKSTKEEGEALSKLLDRIDPVNAALNRLDEQQQQLSKFKNRGLLDSFTQYSKKIEETRNKLTGFNEGLDKGSLSAGQYKQALRQLPAQFTDIFTSLAGGMPLWLVFTQQGGQIADSFGGLGSLFDIIKEKLLGISDAGDDAGDSLSDTANGLSENAENANKLSGFITPARLGIAGLVVALGTLAYAWYQGSKEQDKFNQSLILSGNAIGKTSGQLADITARAAEASGNTKGAAADVINQLVLSGRVAGDSLENVTAAIVSMNDASGTATEQLVDDFNSIAQNPVEAVTKLNDKYHYLTLSTYNQIRALQEQGKQEEAAKLATDDYAKVMQQRADEIQKNLGTLEKIWRALGDTAKAAWDSMLDVGREGSLEQKLAAAKKYVDETRKNGGISNGFWNVYGANYATGTEEQAQSEVNILQSVVDIYGDLNGALGEGRKQQDKSIKAQQYINNLTEQTLTNEQKRTKEQQLLTKAIQDGAQISKEEEARLRKNINDKYKDPVTPKGRAYTEDAATRLLDQINEQNSALNSQLLTSDKLSSATEQRIKFEQQIADLKSKTQLTADQQSILARSQEILQAYKNQEALQNSVKTLDEYQKMQEQIAPKELRQNEILQERLEILQKMVALKKLTPEAAGQQASDLISRSVLPDSVISGVNKAGGTLRSGATNSDLSGQGLNMIGLQIDPQLEIIDNLKQAQMDYATWLNQQQQAITQSTVLNEKQKQDQLLALQQHGQQNQQALSAAVYVAQAQSAQNSFASITNSMGVMFGEQSAMYKAAFVTQKAFAIAQAALQLPMAMGQALAGLPFPANLAAIAQVVGLMSTITSSITSVAATGFMSGGYTGNGGVSSVAGVVHGKEYVFDAGSTKRIGVSNLDALRSGKPLDATLGRSGYGTGAQTVNNRNEGNSYSFVANLPPITINGNPSDATIALTKQAALDGAAMAYRKVVNDMSEGKGGVHVALTGGYKTARRTG